MILTILKLMTQQESKTGKKVSVIAPFGDF